MAKAARRWRAWRSVKLKFTISKGQLKMGSASKGKRGLLTCVALKYGVAVAGVYAPEQY